MRRRESEMLCKKKETEQKQKCQEAFFKGENRKGREGKVNREVTPK